MNKLKVGQELVVTYHGYRTWPKVQTAKISKVGNKFFYLEGNYVKDYKFDLKTLSNVRENGGNYVFQCYLSQQELNDKEEHQRLVKNITPHISRLSLEELRTIHALIYKTL